MTSAFPKGLVVYEVYPKSFSDSNRDGVGDLPGLIHRLDYLKNLGVTAIWLCPVFASPQVDGGYDISNYLAVDPLFGTSTDLTKLIDECHRRGLGILLDLVFNHTSNIHPWFKGALSSPNNPFRDFYIWRDPAPDGGAPNNWLSVFGGPAWTKDPRSGQYYMHSFSAQQPDLNWENPVVRKALKTIMRHWLDRGVDGFRMDAIMWYAKDPSFTDDPVVPGFDPSAGNPYDGLYHVKSRGHELIYSYLRELTETLKQYQNRYMLLEVQFDMLLDVNKYLEFYGRIDRSVAAPFNFIDLYLPWRADRFADTINRFQLGLKDSGQPVYVLGNHDRPRIASRIGYRAARAAAVMQLTLPGVAVIYYGEELGMSDVTAHHTVDIFGQNLPGRGLGRDPERTPMQWSSAEYAAFSTVKPWLPVSADYLKLNVETQTHDSSSMLNLYKSLLQLRRDRPEILDGSYSPLTGLEPHVFGFSRAHEQNTIHVVINFSNDQSAKIHLTGRTLLSSHGKTDGDLAPLEARVIAH